MGKLGNIVELWDFLKTRKKWWLAPILFFLIIFGAIMILSEGSLLAPFIYALF